MGGELQQELQLEKLSLSFDEDGSNSLDVGEMHDMFLSSDKDITLEDCLSLFKFLDEDGSGALSVDEFNLFLKSEEATDSKYSIGDFLVFRKIIRMLRGEGKGLQLLPRNFNRSNT